MSGRSKINIFETFCSLYLIKVLKSPNSISEVCAVNYAINERTTKRSFTRFKKFSSLTTVLFDKERLNQQHILNENNKN